MQVNVNSDALIEHTKTLGEMHRSAFPSAVRGTLNSAAFDMKKETLQESAKSNFINRSPNFFKAFSKVDMAKGWNVSAMKATVGMTKQGLKGESGQAVEDLEEQETGGKIDGRTFIPKKGARPGGSLSKMVKPSNRLGAIKNIVKPKDSTKKGFITSAVHAGKGGYILGKNALFRITSIRQRKGKTIIRKTALYSFVKGRSISVTPTNFAKEAALKTAKKLDDFFKIEANRQFNKLRK